MNGKRFNNILYLFVSTCRRNENILWELGCMYPTLFVDTIAKRQENIKCENTRHRRRNRMELQCTKVWWCDDVFEWSEQLWSFTCHLYELCYVRHTGDHELTKRSDFCCFVFVCAFFVFSYFWMFLCDPYIDWTNALFVWQFNLAKVILPLFYQYLSNLQHLIFHSTQLSHPSISSAHGNVWCVRHRGGGRENKQMVYTMTTTILESTNVGAKFTSRNCEEVVITSHCIPTTARGSYWECWAFAARQIRIPF